MISHNIASIVIKSVKTASCFAYFIWEDDKSKIIDNTPSPHLIMPSKRKITPNSS